MRTSDDIGEIATALSAATDAMKDPGKNKQNPHFRNSYADLASCCEAARHAMAGKGLAIVQGVDTADRTLVTRVVHTSGQWIETAYPVGLDANPQKQASAVTYARRYSLMALLCMSPVEDDDGNSAPERPQQKPSRRNDVPPGAAGRIPPRKPEWPEADRRRFMAALGELSIKYEQLAAYCESKGTPRPSALSEIGRAKLLSKLENDESARADVRAFGASG